MGDLWGKVFEPLVSFMGLFRVVGESCKVVDDRNMLTVLSDVKI